ncbi:MAG: DsbA family protein [Candidatus Jacksonbacteria bacterium]|nr:DsbA family protein [Candidatus Jacksonbacteria bacterium]
MKFYLKTWFIVLLIAGAATLAATLAALSGVASEFDFFTARETPVKEKEVASVPLGFKEGRPTRGIPSARITVVEFSDFQCPFCRESFKILQEVFLKFPDALHFQYRHFPIEGNGSHPLAEEAAEASMCANAQGKFWEYHDLIFQNQDRLTIDSFLAFASSIQLDTTAFAVCFQTHQFADQVVEDFEDARSIGVKATPTFFINGVKIEGTLPLSTWEQLIKELG